MYFKYVESVSDYSNISRRISKLNIKINEDDDDKSSLQHDED
ncbi:MAG TPA: hypothetical protein VFK40_07180 [Nitrososphaeraceae archaeon]|nr:hypothetical protein [Nitrososphaeraceae archaeon]